MKACEITETEGNKFAEMADRVRSVAAKNRDWLPGASAQLNIVAIYLEQLADDSLHGEAADGIRE